MTESDVHNDNATRLILLLSPVISPVDPHLGGVFDLFDHVGPVLG